MLGDKKRFFNNVQCHLSNDQKQLLIYILDNLVDDPDIIKISEFGQDLPWHIFNKLINFISHQSGKWPRTDPKTDK